MNDSFKLFRPINVIIIVVFIILVFSQANKKFVLDEIDFPAVANTISETGTPFEYRGETAPSALGLWHPPLYAYSLGAFVNVFGHNENTVRAFGMCCTLLSALLCLLIYRELYLTNGQAPDRFASIFLSLFLFHPYTIANTTLPDIDSTVLPVTFLLFIYGLTKILGTSDDGSRPTWTVKRTLIMSTLFALNLWTKLTTPLILIPVLMVILYIKGLSLQRSMLISIGVAAVGGLVFLLTYALFCHLLNLPFDYTFLFLISSFTKGSSSGDGILSLFNGIMSHMSYVKQYVNWLGLPFIFALALSCSSLMFQRGKSEKEYIFLVLAGVGLFVIVFYLAITGAFGGFFKYPYPIFSLLTLVIAHYIYEHLFTKDLGSDLIKISLQNRAITITKQHTLLFLFMVVALAVCYYQLAVEKDAVILENHPVNYAYIIFLTVVAVVISALTVKKTNVLYHSSGVAILFAILIGTQFGISRSQAVANYPTKYHYGQIGLEDTVSYLKGELVPNETIWSMKDIGQYANSTYIENYGTVFKSEAEISQTLQDVIKNKGVRYFVVTQGIGQDRVDVYKELKSSLDSCCIVDQEFGNFVIYKAK